MDAPLQNGSIKEQRGVVRFLWAGGVKPVEIHRHMLAQYGQSTVSQRKVYEWRKGLNRVEHVLLMKAVLVGHQHRAQKTTSTRQMP
jgi:hypothetical protein